MNMHTVAVTGASGYVGSHVVRVLLEAGYVVHGTVRDPNDPVKTTHLRQLPGASERLRLFAANLLDESGFDAAFSGCDGLCHVATAARLQAKDPERQIIDPAIHGTRHVLQAASRAGIQRVVMTSSVAAVAGDLPGTYREDSWNDSATPAHSPYPFAKTESERNAWRIASELPPDQRFRLVTLLPCFVQGPVLSVAHLRSSAFLVDQLMGGRMPGVARIRFNLVDVRDVATAHLRALEQEEASGRYILANGALWIAEVAAVLRRHFPDAPIPERRIPDWAMYILALFIPALSVRLMRSQLGKVLTFDATRAREQLGMEFRPLETTLVDGARSILEIRNGRGRSGRRKE